jgi:type IV pilus assembly protein PilV
MSLIEVLVALLIASVGLLTVTELQTLALQSHRLAWQRTEAVLLADDMLERIRAARGVVPADLGQYRIAVGEAPPAADHCLARNCSYAQWVAFDQASWKCRLGAFRAAFVCQALAEVGMLAGGTIQPGLPQGDGAVAVDAGGGVRVSIHWSGVDGRPQTLTLSGRP